MDTSHQQNSNSELKMSTEGPDSYLYSSKTTFDSYCSVKTLIEYDIDKTLDIKEEIILGPEKIHVQKQNKTYESKLCTVQIREEDMLAAKRQLLALKKQEIPESKQEIKYTCKKCARTFKLKSLKRHEKYVCGVMPQYCCKFCDKLFKRKYVMNSHVGRVHDKKSLKRSVVVHKCDKCSKSYDWLTNLNIHKGLVHSAGEKEFVCDYCKYKSKRKSNLKIHITLCHLPRKKQLLCKYCEYKSNWKSNLVKHITLRHLQEKKTIHIDHCEYKSNRKSNIEKHITSPHLPAEKQFICDYCEYKSNRKSNLAQHITSRHLQASKSTYKCDKCARSYNWMTGLSRHKRLAHAIVKPRFICD